jgi:hypothetical protein
MGELHGLKIRLFADVVQDRVAGGDGIVKKGTVCKCLIVSD